MVTGMIMEAGGKTKTIGPQQSSLTCLLNNQSNWHGSSRNKLGCCHKLVKNVYVKFVYHMIMEAGGTKHSGCLTKQCACVPVITVKSGTIINVNCCKNSTVIAFVISKMCSNW